jgi:hypothetical protein
MNVLSFRVRERSMSIMPAMALPARQLNETWDEFEYEKGTTAGGSLL